MAERSRPSNLPHFTKSLIVHRRSVRLDAQTWTALSFRPAETVRFATNYFHETWHILGGLETAHLLGRVCWAMAFQRVERTMFVIERTHLVPNPFDADPSSTIVIVNSDLGTPNHQARIALKRHLPWGRPSEGRVTLRTHGLNRVGDKAVFETSKSAAGRRSLPNVSDGGSTGLMDF